MSYQLRRYDWSAKLPLSILTDFEEFAVYDCRVKPGKNDSAAVGRVMYLNSGRYAEKWDEIAAIFSREAVLKGSFDKFADNFVGSGGGGGGGYGIALREGAQIDYYCLLGLLNSNLLSLFLRSVSTPFRGGYIALNRQYIVKEEFRSRSPATCANLFLTDRPIRHRHRWSVFR